MKNTSTAGNAPSANSQRQPRLGTISSPAPAAANFPTGQHSGSMALTRPRIRAGAYSATSAWSIGTIPPSPRPVRNRAPTMNSSDIDNPAIPVNTENISTVAANTTRRPHRSATQPQNHDPRPMPANAADPIRPICFGSRPKSCLIIGSAYETMTISKESKKNPLPQPR
jgi:hypothetical protein